MLAILCLLLLNIRPVRGQDPAADLERTALVGNKVDARHVAYEALSTKASPLVGFEFGIGNKPPFVQVAAVRPIFKGEASDRPAAGRFETATVNGKKVKTSVHTTEKVVAKDGYAVSKVVVQYGLWIDSIQVHFARIKGDGLNLGDTYHSNSFGSDQAKGKYTTLDAGGRLVVGVTGTADDVKATGFGLVYAGKPAVAVKPQVPSRVVIPKETGGLTAKAPNAGGTETPNKRPANKSAPGREAEEDVRARIEKQNAEAKKQIEAFNAEAQKQQAAADQAFAHMPKLGALSQNPEAGKEAWRKALDSAEADPNLTEEKRAEIGQFRKVLGLEPKTDWLAIALGVFVLAGVGGAHAYYYLRDKRAAVPPADRVTAGPAEPLELDDALAHPRPSPRD